MGLVCFQALHIWQHPSGDYYKVLFKLIFDVDPIKSIIAAIASYDIYNISQPSAHKPPSPLQLPERVAHRVCHLLLPRFKCLLLKTCKRHFLLMVNKCLTQWEKKRSTSGCYSSSNGLQFEASTNQWRHRSLRGNTEVHFTFENSVETWMSLKGYLMSSLRCTHRLASFCFHEIQM